MIGSELRHLRPEIGDQGAIVQAIGFLGQHLSSSRRHSAPENESAFSARAPRVLGRSTHALQRQ